jgi:hypothetical protein
MDASRKSAVAKTWPTPTVLIVFGGWLILLSTGWWVMTAYSFKRDALRAGGPIERWPDDSQLPRIEGRDTMLVFLHPKCPCSRATVAELQRLFASRGNYARPVSLCVVATIPASAQTSWAQTSLVERSLKLDHARLHVDRGGIEAVLFRAEVSGTVMLFDANGALRYAGGITASRGHEGDNAGRDALAGILAGERYAAHFPTFGCRLVLERDLETAVGAEPVATTSRAGQF